MSITWGSPLTRIADENAAAQLAWKRLYHAIEGNCRLGDQFRRAGDRRNAEWHYNEATRLTRIAEGRGK